MPTPLFRFIPRETTWRSHAECVSSNSVTAPRITGPAPKLRRAQSAGASVLFDAPFGTGGWPNECTAFAGAFGDQSQFERASPIPQSGGWPNTLPVPWPPRGVAGMGYLPDQVDRRDHGWKDIQDRFATLNPHGTPGARFNATMLSVADDQSLPPSVRLGDHWEMPAIENQGTLGSCAAHAVIGMMEFLEYKTGGDPLDLSRMFVYRTARSLMGVSGDTGIYLRTAIRALRLFGAPPESVWPYDPRLLDTEPPAFAYSYADDFSAVSYARLDGVDLATNSGSAGEELLNRLKRCLAAGFPVAFGFPVHESFAALDSNFVIPMPGEFDSDRLIGGHAVLAVGYDDSVPYRMGDKEFKGAVIIRNSWGEEWADHGYAYMPYSFFTELLAQDLWSIFSTTWVRESAFA